MSVTYLCKLTGYQMLSNGYWRIRLYGMLKSHYKNDCEFKIYNLHYNCKKYF